MRDYYGPVLKTPVLMVLTVFLIVMVMMVVALAAAAAAAAAVVVINVTEKLFWGRHVYCKKCCL